MPPGGEGKISIKVNTKGYGGRKLMKTITVITNDSKTPESNISVSGNVEKFADITPSVVRFNGKIGEELKTVVKVVPESKFPFLVLKVRSQEEKAKNIKYELKEDKAASGNKEYSITVENLKKDAGFYYDVLILETDSKIQPEIKINVMGRIIDPNAQEKSPLQGINENNAVKNPNAPNTANTNNGAKNNNFLEVIQKIQQQNAQQQNLQNGSNQQENKLNATPPLPVDGNAASVAPAQVQDPKRAEELKKKFEALIKQAQEKQKAQEQENSQTQSQPKEQQKQE
ncbi:MAG: hypothetical protein HQK63_01240 [Desulfamplus sp.]|nr:hypothetical protein [Desulfamplus sp.]